MFTKNSRNRYDKKDSLELGQNAESKFAEAAKKLGWIISPASQQGNMNEHYDYLIKKDEKAFKVEVKSLKRMSRSDSSVQDQFIWIELHGVRKNDKGWLYGFADLIAFEMTRSFRIVKRIDLVGLVNSLVDFNTKVSLPKDALYKLYSRQGRPDVLTIIKSDDLLNIQSTEWKKTD